MCKLGILDSTGIMGKTLGHTVKLPAAVTYTNFFQVIKSFHVYDMHSV